MPARPPIIPHDAQSWSKSKRYDSGVSGISRESRPRSQPPTTPSSPSSEKTDYRREKKRGPNHVKPRPANPAVISSIIDSLGSLTPPPAIPTDDYYSETGSRRSRPHSSNGSFGSKKSLPHSATMPAVVRPGFGMEYGVASPYVSEEQLSDAALPPTIPTSRSPSGLSRYSAPRTPSFTSTSNANGTLQPPSVTSRSSSFTSRERTPNKMLSAESWVKNNAAIASRDTLDTKSSQSSLRRKKSQETLRPVRTYSGKQMPTRLDGYFAVKSSAELKDTQTPPPRASAKGRLYLGDSTVDEQSVPPASPHFVANEPELVLSDRKAGKQPSIASSEPSNSSSKRSSQTAPSPIADSIPLRTSSLRHSSSSPKPKKKRDRSQKRQTIAGSAFKSSTPSEPIPETSWADLGDDDETVKRIRELRKQRETRLRESRAYSMPDGLPTLDTTTNDTPVPAIPSATDIRGIDSPVNHGASPNDTPFENVEQITRRSEERKRASRVRPLANRASTEPSAKACKVLGITTDLHDVPMPTPNKALYVNGSRDTSVSPELVREEKRPRSSHWRPPTALSSSSPTPPLSLDYSYVQAVAALQGVEREMAATRPTTANEVAARRSIPGAIQPGPRRASNPPPALDLDLYKDKLPLMPNNAQVTASNAPVPRPRSRSRKSINPKDRWTTVHPDLPLDFEKKKNRRRSMSDAVHRNTKIVDQPLQALERVDSIETAVQDYLSAERLSRFVYHPLTRRKISYSEVGDPEGAPVFICVGMGLTRYVGAFYDELAITLRLRLITVERPGVGGSDPFPANDKSGPLSWPDDVLAICQRLDIARFSILAHSAGAIYALATALILPHLVKGKVHLLAPWIPPSQLETVSHPAASAPPAGALPRSQRILRVLPTPFLRAANSSFMTATSASLKPASKRKIHATKVQQQREASLSPSRGREGRPRTAHSEKPDFARRESMMLMDQFMPETNPMENFPITIREEEEHFSSDGQLFLSATATPTDPSFEFASVALNAAEHAERERQVEYTSRLTQRTWELATRDSNPATDLLVCLERHRDVGFRYTDVNREVVITHGSEDKRVPIGNVKWLAEQMNRRALAGLAGTESVPTTRDGFEPGKGGCEVRVLEGEGHGLMASAPIMGDILTEIAGYWRGEDRGRMTM